MGRLLFIQDNGVNENLGVMSIAGMLRAYGHEADLILTDEHPKTYPDLIAGYRPDLIAFSFMTGNRDWAYATARTLKETIFHADHHGGCSPNPLPGGYRSSLR